MNAHTVRQLVAGPAGAIECALDAPAAVPPRGVAIVCHPHPQHGGTLDNKVAQTLARAFVQLGHRAVRFNFRGVGASQGAWDEGRGEVDDALAVIAAHRDPGLPLLLAGFSFGAYVAAQAAQELPDEAKPQRLVLVGPSTEKQQMAAVPADTVVILDLQRHERWVVEASERIAAAGAARIAIVDSELSPLAEGALAVLPVAPAGVGPFDSQIGVLAVANALLAGVALRLRRNVTRRIDALEAAWTKSGALLET